MTFPLAGCVVNPVTGQSEFELVSTAQQIKIGEQQYAPAQQMQGGPYILDPALTSYVSGVGQRLAREAPIDLPYEFVVLNNSVPNAWALPGGKIAVNRGLLVELRNEAELAAVLGHEIVHAAARHGAKSIERGMLLQSAVLATQMTTQDTALGDTLTQSVQAGANLINFKYGRDAERESDYYGTRYLAKAGYDPYAAVTLQETFLRLSQGRSSTWLEGLFASHPPSQERVTNNRQLLETLREEGFLDGDYGADRYQAAVRQIKKDQPAYQQMDEARQAMFNAEYDDALSAIGKALELQNNEAQFHGLRGDIRARQARYEDAVTNYDRAVARDPGYFSYYLGRGIAQARLEKLAPARQDLNHSVELLPTTIAYLELGKVAEAQGDAAAAVRYYEAAGQSGEIGAEAWSSLARLDVGNRPERYLSSRTGATDDGRWLVRVQNDTAIAMADIRVRVEFVDGNGHSGAFERTFAMLRPGAHAQLGFPADSGKVTRAWSRVIAARTAR